MNSTQPTHQGEPELCGVPVAETQGLQDWRDGNNVQLDDQLMNQKVYQPGHPDAHENGFVSMLKVDDTGEMVDSKATVFEAVRLEFEPRRRTRARGPDAVLGRIPPRPCALP